MKIIKYSVRFVHFSPVFIQQQFGCISLIPPVGADPAVQRVRELGEPKRAWFGSGRRKVARAESKCMEHRH